MISLRFSQLLAGAQPPSVSPGRRRPGLRGASTGLLIEASYEEARRGVRFEEDRAVDPEAADLSGRRRLAVHRDLGEDPAEDGRELVAMRRAERDEDAGVIGEPVDDEVAVRRHRVQARLRGDLRSELLGQVTREERRQAVEADLVSFEAPRRGRDLVA